MPQVSKAWHMRNDEKVSVVGVNCSRSWRLGHNIGERSRSQIIYSLVGDDNECNYYLLEGFGNKSGLIRFLLQKKKKNHSGYLLERNGQKQKLLLWPRRGVILIWTESQQSAKMWLILKYTFMVAPIRLSPDTKGKRLIIQDFSIHYFWLELQGILYSQWVQMMNFKSEAA